MHGMMRSNRRLSGWTGLAAATAMSGLMLGLPGCVGYNVYPPEVGDRGFTNPNDDPFPPVMTAALQWAAVRYPPNTGTEFSVAAPAGPEQAFTLNLPSGVSAILAERIAKNVGYGAEPLYPGNDKLPVYHVARVWVSGDEAKVDVVRPIRGLPMSAAAGMKDASQGITIRLRGGVQQWRVTSHRVWSINSMAVPALNFVTGYPAGARTIEAVPADAANDSPAVPMGESEAGGEGQ
jgi:hypothetical protein